MEGTRHGRLISAQMLDVAVRVRSIRQYAVTQMVRTFYAQISIKSRCLSHFDSVS